MLLYTIVTVMDVMHEPDNAYSIWSTLSCYWLVQFLMVAYNGKYCILDLSSVDLLLIFSHLDVSF